MAAALTPVRRSRRAALPAVGRAAGRAQPNDLDLQRIAQAIDQRARYRYVTPLIEGVESGYQISSPCCSRNVDAAGGVIQIARLLYVEHHDEWLLYRKDHRGGAWVMHTCARRLADILAHLRDDPSRVFWP
jgi:hypothetical protein